jgi:ADP-ribose pyrophosphatase YjhB (NUDIX family)
MINCTFEDGNKASLRHVVVDTVVTKDDKILLVKRAAKLLEGGKWSLAGGFVDRDETTAQAAAREVMEETGWQVTDLTLLGIKDNPNRRNDDRQNVSFVYFATAAQKTGESDWETDEQKWFSWDELPNDGDIAFDHAENISLYRKYLKDKPALPII